MTLNQLFWKLIKEEFTLHEGNFGGAAKISTVYLSFKIINDTTYHFMNPDAHVTYQTVNLCSSDKCFIYFTSDVPTLHLMKSAQHPLYNSGKGRCTRYMWSNDMFILWNCISAIFMKIENAIYISFQNSTLLFNNGLIFFIMDIQNNQSLELEWIPMPAQLRSANDWRFFWLRNVFLKSFQDWLNSFQQCQGKFTKDTGQKMFMHNVANYEGLKISVN